MATWQQFEREAPELAAAIRLRFEATKHHVIATVRSDGSPRVSGTEVAVHGEHLTVGSMPDARKARDLQRDPRYALHANPGDGSMEGGDAKIAGRATEIVDDEALARYVDDMEPPPGPFHLFVLDIDEAVLTSLHPAGDRIVVEWWRPGVGVRRVERG